MTNAIDLFNNWLASSDRYWKWESAKEEVNKVWVCSQSIVAGCEGDETNLFRSSQVSLGYSLIKFSILLHTFGCRLWARSGNRLTLSGMQPNALTSSGWLAWFPRAKIEEHAQPAVATRATAPDLFSQSTWRHRLTCKLARQLESKRDVTVLQINGRTIVIESANWISPYSLSLALSLSISR